MRASVHPFRASLVACATLSLLATHPLFGAELQGRKAPRLVIHYATCSLNLSFLAPYASNVSFTPALAKLARKGLVFERHQTESGQSGVSYASIFTGLQASENGVYSHPSELPAANRTVTEMFAGAGWRTHAYLLHGMASKELKYDQGASRRHSYDALLEADDPRFIRVLHALKTNPSRHDFVVTNFTDTHAPYPTEYVEAFCARYPGECNHLGGLEESLRVGAILRDRMSDLIWKFDATIAELGYDEKQTRQFVDVAQMIYKSNVWRLDQRIGRLLHALESAGLLEDTLIAFTADHGEILHREGSHLSYSHGMQLAPEVLNVPLIVYGPSAGVPPGRYPGVTRSIDIAWTLLGLSGVAPPAHSGDGRNLSAAIRGQRPPPDLIAYSHTALMNDAFWGYLKQQPIMQLLHPTQGPESMWVGARRGDTLFRLLRETSGQWKHSALNLLEGPESADLFDPDLPSHR
jgi:arylsulfatase A-like enzyme